MGLSLSDILEARKRIQNYLLPTPLLRCEKLEKQLNFQGRIYFKLESEQPTGSFKVRGAFNNMLQQLFEMQKKGVVTRSSGNFAQAVSFAARTLDVPATIVMPENAPKTKLEGTKKYGAKIILSGNRHEEGEKIVAQLVKEKGFIPIHPYNDTRTMAGQGTAALEILEQCPDVGHFFCPIGGGGLLSGCAMGFKETNPKIQIHGIEPAGAADYTASRKSGKREIWERIETIADGLRASSVGELNYPILNRYVDDVRAVSEKEIKVAMKMLFDIMQIKAEPSGVVSLAGFLNTFSKIKGNVVILISGKNVDAEPFKQWIQEAEAKHPPSS